MDTVINVPSKSTTDAIEDNTNFNTEQENADKRHQEVMCKLDDINNNLKVIAAYFSLIMDQTITKDDV